MRLVVMVVTLAIGVTANAGTVYKTQAKAEDGTFKKLVVLDDKPNRLLPACRCVTGMWKLGSETNTHFIGTLQDASSNHARPNVRSFDVKVRKTRELMGMHRDYRATLHGILRDKGQLVVREVSGGEWEVVGYASEPLGKLFENNTEWNADPRHPPKPAQPSPIVDPDADAAALAKLINDYRASIKLPRVAISVALTKVAQAHVHDLNVNKPVKQGCNQHSWSANGSWTACCYDGSAAASRCMWVKPKEIAGYRGKGYEVAANAAGITPERALELWQQSRAHHEVMTNQGIWTDPWRAMGVAIDGDYAVAWFGEEK